MVRCAYFMIRKRWALRINFEELVRFIADLDVEELFSYLDKSPSVTYLSSTSVTDIIEAISRPIEEELLSSLRNAKYFALLADESTDKANREQFSIMCKWLHNNEVKGHYMGLIHVKKPRCFKLADSH